MEMRAAAPLLMSAALAVLATPSSASECSLDTLVRNGQFSLERAQSGIANFTEEFSKLKDNKPHAVPRYYNDVMAGVLRATTLPVDDAPNAMTGLNPDPRNQLGEDWAVYLMEKVMYPSATVISEADLKKTDSERDVEGTPDAGFQWESGECTYAQVVRVYPRGDEITLKALVLDKISKSLTWLRVLAQQVAQGKEKVLGALGPGGFTIFVWLYDGPNGDMMDISGMANMMKEIQEQENRFELLIYSIEGNSNILFPGSFRHKPKDIKACPSLTQVIDKCKKGPPSVQETLYAIDFDYAWATPSKTSQKNDGVFDQQHNQQEGSSGKSNNPAETPSFLIGGFTQIGMNARKSQTERKAKPHERKFMSDHKKSPLETVHYDVIQENPELVRDLFKDFNDMVE